MPVTYPTPASPAPSLVMGVVNATPNSFSDAGLYPDEASRRARIDELVALGADVIDIGGQSAVTGVPETDAQAELAAVVPLVRHTLESHPGVEVSVDTYKPIVAEGVLAAGAHVINDVSGLINPTVADLVAAADARLVITYNLSRPKERLTDPTLYTDLVGQTLEFLTAKIEEVEARGVPAERVIADPGPDFAKTPAQTIALLQRSGEFAALGVPVLMAVSRKDFIGAVLRRAPDARDPGTVAVVSFLETLGDWVYRVHDVAAAVDAVRMSRVMLGKDVVPADLELPVELRRVKASLEAN